MRISAEFCADRRSSTAETPRWISAPLAVLLLVVAYLATGPSTAMAGCGGYVHIVDDAADRGDPYGSPSEIPADGPECSRRDSVPEAPIPAAPPPTFDRWASFWNDVPCAVPGVAWRPCEGTVRLPLGEHLPRPRPPKSA